MTSTVDELINQDEFTINEIENQLTNQNTLIEHPVMEQTITQTDHDKPPFTEDRTPTRHMFQSTCGSNVSRGYKVRRWGSKKFFARLFCQANFFRGVPAFRVFKVAGSPLKKF
jgi:hypothetical protein